MFLLQSLGAEVSPAVTVKLKHEEHQGVYKGLCGLAGIFLFYIFSRLQAIISKMKDDVSTCMSTLKNIIAQVHITAKRIVGYVI